MREEVLARDFLERFPDSDYAGRRSLLDSGAMTRLLSEFKRLRLTDETVYLRNAAINVINGMINMTFSCDGTHYIDHETFIAELDKFETTAGA